MCVIKILKKMSYSIDDFITVGDVLVVETTDGLILLTPDIKLLRSGWKLTGLTQDGQEIYSKSSKLNYMEDEEE